MTTEPRHTGVSRGRRWVRAVALAGAAFAPGFTAIAHAQPAPATPTPTAAPADASKRVAAYIYGSVPVTREELGEFLIARGGMDKIDLVVNRRVIEVEAARRGVTVTPHEVGSGLAQDLQGIGVSQDEFVRMVLPRYGKTLYEWEQDVIRPRLLLGKMARDRVAVADDDLKRAFESRYGEKREAQVIVWPKGKDGLSKDVKALVLAKPDEFDKMAAKQPNELAKTGGRINPIGRHIDGEDPRVEEALFSLKVGETKWVETEATSTCVRCIKIIPPDESVTLDKVRTDLTKEVTDKKLNAAIPKLFEELKTAASPALTTQVPQRPQTDPNAPPAPRAEHADPRVLAVLHGNMNVTREDLGEFLIARGGYAKLELLVNKKIIDAEAARRGVAVTPEEIEAGLESDLKGLGVTKGDFVKVVLPKYGKTLGEWTDDVVRPRLVLAKMCRDRVRVAPDDVQKLFENRYGEKRQAKMIVWGKDEARAAQRQWEEIRQGADQAARDANFDRMARMQRDPNLAAAAGAVAPIGRHTDAEDARVEQVVFSLRVGEVSHLFETPIGIMCVKCVGVVPPAAGVTPDAVRPALEKDVYERKLAKEIPAYFGELKAAANPNLLLKGPPTDRENEEGVRQLIQQVGGTTPKK